MSISSVSSNVLISLFSLLDYYFPTKELYDNDIKTTEAKIMDIFEQIKPELYEIFKRKYPNASKDDKIYRQFFTDCYMDYLQIACDYENKWKQSSKLVRYNTFNINTTFNMLDELKYYERELF